MSVKRMAVAPVDSRPPVRFQRVHPLRAHEYVAEQIRRHIALRLVQPGEALPSERELASMFGVGRPTIQQAMRLLEASHLIEARRGRYGGTFVSAPNADETAVEEFVARVQRASAELQEMLLWRRLVEPAVAGAAAELRRRVDITRMRRAVAAMAAATEESDYMRYDTEFHLAIADAVRNTLVLRSLEDMRIRLSDAVSLLPESDLWHRRIADEHGAVLDAIEARDRSAARDAMEAHVASAEQGLRAVLAAVKRRRPLPQ